MCVLALVSLGLTTNLVWSRKESSVTSTPGDFGCRPVVLAGSIGIQCGKPQAGRLQIIIRETRDLAFIVDPQDPHSSKKSPGCLWHWSEGCSSQLLWVVVWVLLSHWQWCRSFWFSWFIDSWLILLKESLRKIGFYLKPSILPIFITF